MISHTCLIPPTGVPVDVITHCAWELDPPAGSCKMLPAGHVVDTFDCDTPAETLAMPRPERTIVPAASAVPAAAEGRPTP